MATNHDVIPVKDGPFDTFQSNFITLVTANAGAWNIDAAKLAALTALQAPWAAAYALDKVPGTKNAVTTANKNQARRNYEALMRPFIQTEIRGNTLISDADLAAMNIAPIDTVRTEAGIITDVPMVELQPGNGNSVELFLSKEADEVTPSSRALPPGVGHIEVVYRIGETPALPTECNRTVIAKKGHINLSLTPDVAGQRLYAYARYVNTRNLPSNNWSLRASIVIPGN